MPSATRVSRCHGRQSNVCVLIEATRSGRNVLQIAIRGPTSSLLAGMLMVTG